MKKFEHLEIICDVTEDGYFVDIGENYELQNFGFTSLLYEKNSVTVDELRQYSADPNNFIELGDLLNQLGQYGWECISIRATQHWIRDLPRITHTKEPVKNLVIERSLSAWLKREIQ
jgi:hypothetical protein